MPVGCRFIRGGHAGAGESVLKLKEDKTAYFNVQEDETINSDKFHPEHTIINHSIVTVCYTVVWPHSK